MAFLQPEQLDSLAIEKMIFHVVGPEDDGLLLLEEVTPGAYTDFFLDRLKSTNTGIMFDFLQRSSLLTSLAAIESDLEVFTAESKKLASLFKEGHGRNTIKGVFFLFLLSSKAERFYAVVKYDHQTVLSYVVENRAAGAYPLIQQLQDTFVKSPDALQKSAIVRLTGAGGELCVKDRVQPREITQYFKTFLGARRRHTAGGLTEKLVEIANKVARECKTELGRDVRKEFRQRLYDTVQTQAGFDPSNSEVFMTSVFGPLSEDSNIRRVFDKKLKALNLEGEAFDFDRKVLPRPAKRRIVTTEGIQIIYDREYQDKVTVTALAGGLSQITIVTGGVEENDDFPNRNSQ